jgi:hypothetical protein
MEAASLMETPLGAIQSVLVFGTNESVLLLKGSTVYSMQVIFITEMLTIYQYGLIAVTALMLAYHVTATHALNALLVLAQTVNLMTH